MLVMLGGWEEERQREGSFPGVSVWWEGGRDGRSVCYSVDCVGPSHAGHLPLTHSHPLAIVAARRSPHGSRITSCITQLVVACLEHGGEEYGCL